MMRQFNVPCLGRCSRIKFSLCCVGYVSEVKDILQFNHNEHPFMYDECLKLETKRQR